MKKGIIWAVGIIIVIVLISYFMRSSKTAVTEPVLDTTPTASTTVPVTEPITVASTSVASVKEFTVTGKNFSFAPSTLTVKKGDTVKITFINSAGFHDLKIDEFKAATARIGSGKQETITFVADKAGSFEYYCSVGEHREMGMKGTLIVQ